MPFEKFVPSQKTVGTQKNPEAKMLKGGQISLNGPAYEKYLKGSTHVELYYDPVTKRIVLKGKKYGTKAALKFGPVAKGKSTFR